MNPNDLPKCKKGMTLYEAQLDAEGDKILVTTWTLVSVTNKSFAIESIYGTRENGRIYNYFDRIRRLHTTKEGSVRYLVDLCQMEVSRAEERLVSKRGLLRHVERLVKNGDQSIILLKARK